MKPHMERSYSKLEWFFYIIVLPVIFISILIITLLWFFDYNVKNTILSTLNKVPVVEKFIDDSQLNNNNGLSINNNEQLQKTIIDLKNTITDNNTILKEEGIKISAKNEEIGKLNDQIKELQAKLNEKATSEQTREQEITNLAKLYSNMNPQNAANIISNLTTNEAILVLGKMNIDSKSKILEKMDQKKAANLSFLLIDSKYSKDIDIKALQERIQALTDELDSLKSKDITKIDYQQLAYTYASMDSQKAADTILSIANSDIHKAQNILIAMDPVARSKILEKMDATDAAKLSIGIVK